MTEPPSRFDLARQSYQENLDATKHQDDKIGRFLAAIAFLTGGALVFFDRDVLGVLYRLGNRDLPLAAWSLGAFLVLVSMSVLLLILSLATPLTMPVARKRLRLGRSHLFFLAIAGETEESWRRLWRDDGSLGRKLEKETLMKLGTSRFGPTTNMIARGRARPFSWVRSSSSFCP